jgi:hypothetical protein
LHRLGCWSDTLRGLAFRPRCSCPAFHRGNRAPGVRLGDEFGCGTQLIKSSLLGTRSNEDARCREGHVQSRHNVERANQDFDSVRTLRSVGMGRRGEAQRIHVPEMWNGALVLRGRMNEPTIPHRQASSEHGGSGARRGHFASRQQRAKDAWGHAYRPI